MRKEDAKQKVVELVVKYQNLNTSQIKEFHEAKTKQGFIVPMFRALGWDFDDTNEVAPEEKASNGRVDYAFKLLGVSQFYVEAKALHADLTREDYIKQAITYAYNKGVTWAILTDFEKLQIYNAQTGHNFINLSQDNYINNFDDLWLLSKESLQNNGLNERAEKYGALPPRQEIEKKLFEQLSNWREELFTQIYLHNDKLKLNIDQIDEVIQKLFNRLIFIRNCEDRGIEDKVLLGTINEWRSNKRKGELIDKIKTIFHDFDGYYDSDLFAPHILDQQNLFIESTTIEGIVDGLYKVPRSIANYDFSLMKPDVLGAVYEQYLGHIAIVVKERAKKEQTQMSLGLLPHTTIELTAKKEHRKERGIYYTPEFITNYIVQQTIGYFLKDHSYNEIHNIKILDPSCGSGSFLIKAFDELLNYHAIQKGKSVNELDQYECLPILTGNIFGVDLDKQAVEIARLNLLLRSLAKRELLPSLADNIRQGNSLISGIEQELEKYFGSNWREKRPFIWESEYNDIMSNGGFDIVIGNPPYVRVDSLPDEEKTYWKVKFKSAVGKYDLYYLFIEIALKLAKDNGMLAFITPNRYCTNTTGENLRRLIFNKGAQIIVTSLSRLTVFEEAANYPVIIIIRKTAKSTHKKLIYYDVKSFQDLNLLSPSYELSENELNVLPRAIIPINVDFPKLTIALKLIKKAIHADQFVKIQEGLRIPVNWETKISENEHQVPIIKQFQFSRYSGIKRVSYLSGKRLKTLLSTNAERISNSYKSKIIFAEDALRIEATIDEKLGLCQGGVYFATLKDEFYSLYYLLSVFNSELLTFIFKCLYSGIHMGGEYLRFRTQYLQELPIYRPDFNNTNEKKIYDNLISLAHEMIELNKNLDPIRDLYSIERDELIKQIDYKDKEINNLVYDLYGLNSEERKIVKGGFSCHRLKLESSVERGYIKSKE